MVCKGMGLLLVLGCCTAAGFRYAGSLSRNVHTIEQLIRYWKAFTMLLRLGRGEPAEIVTALSAGSEFGKLPFARRMGQAAHREKDFERILHAVLQSPEELPRGVCEALLPLGGMIGRSDLQNQLRALENTLCLLAQEKEYWEERAKKRGGLSRRLGVLGGLLAVVILL